MNTLAARVLALLCSCWFVSPGHSAEEGPPRSVTLERNPRPFPVWPGFEGFVNNVINEGGKTLARGAFVSAEGANRVYPQGREHLYQLRFPDLQVGDVVPLFGGVYYVQSTSPGSDAGGSVDFLRLPAGDLPLPQAAKVTKEAYVFTFGIGGGGRLHEVPFHATYAMTREGKATATIVIREHQRQQGERVVRDVGGKQTAHVGEWFQLGNFRHRVVNIVAPDPKRKIIGWFELEQKPLK